MRFTDRSDAGRQLASSFSPSPISPMCAFSPCRAAEFPSRSRLPQRLHAPLDVWVVRKLGAPEIPELAIGAIAPGGIKLLSPDIIERLHISPQTVEAIAAREYAELERRERAYRGDRPPVEVSGKTVILVDDGLATGSTMRAAIASLRQRSPARIVVAVPVAALPVCAQLQQEGSEVVCLSTPIDLDAVGQWYDDFTQTSDERSLRPAAARLATAPRPAWT